MPTKFWGFSVLFFMINLVGSAQVLKVDTLNNTGNFFKTRQLQSDEDLRIKEIHDELEKALKDINDQFAGSIYFGLNGQEVKRDNFFVINTGISLSNGVYPFKFELNSGILAQIQNGSFSETVSNVSISFDYNFSDKNLSKQSYVFLNGTNNSYLGIDQRYEIGGGFILNYYSGNRSRKVENLKSRAIDERNESGLTEEGVQKLMALNGGNHSFNSEDRFLKAQLEKLQVQGEGKDREEVSILLRKRRRVVNTLIKNFSSTRLSFLAGLNYELEKTADSLELFDGDQKRNRNFTATNRYRLVLRPGLDWRGENFSFSSKYYIKTGVFEEFYNRVDDGINSDKRLDYWTEWITSFRFNFTQKIGVSITYTLFYDNAPNRAFFNVSTTGGSNFRLFSAENKFKAILLSFTYGL
ncbi:hypothetical protein [Muriicola soli]|uniref:DUF481 domain-containing protein n=1 Tax=Muriicola soli TaxID=2507538 RepID=A0A411EB86_9FLAO|nr:hypothetical protein [Muriicola soli]QBA64793.1 hypothetical protein EQY75_09800 [Muriicola soli]